MFVLWAQTHRDGVLGCAGEPVRYQDQSFIVFSGFAPQIPLKSHSAGIAYCYWVRTCATDGVAAPGAPRPRPPWGFRSTHTSHASAKLVPGHNFTRRLLVFTVADEHNPRGKDPNSGLGDNHLPCLKA